MKWWSVYFIGRVRGSSSLRLCTLQAGHFKPLVDIHSNIFTRKWNIFTANEFLQLAEMQTLP